jgi:hypothetical protein
MAVPTLRLPSVPFLPEGMAKNQAGFAGRRYMLKHYPVTNPTLGLNTKYRAKFDRNEALFNDDFDTVFVPQPTFNQCSHSEKSWFVAGSIGKCLLQFMAHCG